MNLQRVGRCEKSAIGTMCPFMTRAQLVQFLVRQLQEFLEQAELVHQLERGRMNRVAAEIAVEIGVLLQHRHFHAGTRQQITGHHSRRAASDDDATRANVRCRRSEV